MEYLSENTIAYTSKGAMRVMNLSTKLDAHATGVFTQMSNHKLALEARGVDVIDLSTGTPDLPPAQHVMDALIESAKNPLSWRYAIKDKPELLEAAADWYARRFSVTLDPKTQICALMGSQDGLSHLCMAICDPGDVVLGPDPGYPIFEMGALIANCEYYGVPCREEDGYVMDLSAVPEEVAKRARLIIASYPSNPTGALADRAFYEGLVAFAKKYDIAVLHDNAYCELYAKEEVGSFLAIPGAIEVGVEFNSLSKSYSMPGCRVGFAVGNSELVGKLSLLKSHVDFGTFFPVQDAAIAALRGPQQIVGINRDAYNERRYALYEGLKAIGWPIKEPEATMFVWAKLPKGYTDSAAFAQLMMEKTGVIAVPGIAFGPMGEGHVRFGLVQNVERIVLAVRRIGESGIVTQGVNAPSQEANA